MTLNNSINANATTPLSTTSGGTGVSAPTAHTIPVAEGSSAMTFLGPLTNGQLLIGSTGADPVAASLTAGSGVTITPGAGTITISASGSAVNVNENIIIGGNFDNNPWQRGTSFVSPSDGDYTADRFQYSQLGTGAVTISKTADAPSVGSTGIYVTNCLDVDTTTAEASLAATSIYAIIYKIEGYDFNSIAQQAFTVSFWVKATVTGIYSLHVADSDLGEYYIAEYTVNTTNTWELKTVTIPASPSSGNWNYTNGIGLAIRFIIAAGTGRFGTVGAWTSSGTNNTLASSNQVNGMSSTSNNFKLDLIKVELGSSATAWVEPLVEVTLSKCQRYYEKSYTQSTNPGASTVNGCTNFIIGDATTGNLFQLTTFAVVKRTTPTIVFYDLVGASGKCYKGANGIAASVNSGTTGSRSFSGGTTDATSSNELSYHFTADAEL